MNEHEFIGRLDGSERVSVQVANDGRLQVAIAHEFGYRLDEIRGGGALLTLILVRDDAPDARRRAALTTSLHRANGAWWESCLPPRLRQLPDAVTPAQAGAARIAVHRFDRNGTSAVRAFLLIGAVAALLGAGYAHDTPPLALALLTLAGALVALMPAMARWTLAAHRRQLAVLERFERQRGDGDR
ncbi:hypothetical protein [Streptomyces sp. NBRC 109706]|uniref:hypothetical protein n=1 Tax=Streptomyces sp. NBRC 109706 TaxID=1550035 RepID=UPI000780FB61|nr:hypothetical protein [Streptomyces sp. NBRC 109706]